MNKIDWSQVFVENEVAYTCHLKTAKALGFARICYRWYHRSGASGLSSVYCRYSDLDRLLLHWSRFKAWHYTR
jgi:hypothetical protein